MRWSDLSPQHELGFGAWVTSFVLLLTPTATLGLLAARTESLPIAVGAGVQALFLLVFLRAHPVWRPPISVSIVVLYLVAVLWAWIPLRQSTDWAPPLAQGLLLLIGVGLFAVHDLFRTGAEPLRQALRWTRRLTSRRHWPEQVADCRTLPEVAHLRGAIRDEPGPVLALLSDRRPQVQTAALGALEYRPHWRPGEAELVLKIGWESEEPAVRAAAAYALAGVGTAELVAGLADFLRDPVPEVRRAAAEALMWDADARWPFARDGVREALADPALYDDRAMFAGIGRLPAAAVADLITWSAEHPPLAGRAILTLVEHYHADLLAAERPELGAELSAKMLDNETSPALRVEIAALLREHHLLTADMLDRLTNLDQPAPIRLFAAELMLRINPHDPDGVDVLRGLARQPNRELAVRVAAVLQSVLGWDMGLPEGELPQPNSKEAADITRRVLAWANGVTGMTQDVLRPTPGPRAGLAGGSRHAMYGFGSRSSVPGLPTRPPSRMVMEESAMPPEQSSLIPDQPSLIPDQSSQLPERPEPPPTTRSAPPPVRQAPPPVPTRRDVAAPSRHSQPEFHIDEAPPPPTTRHSQPELHIDEGIQLDGAIQSEEEVSEDPGHTDVSIGESSLFSAGPEVSVGESSLFSAHPDMPIGESSMLPHDEVPPPPKPPRRPGSSAVL
jgi:hypothetical protein